MRNPSPLVVVLFWEVYEFAYIGKDLPLYPLHIFGDGVENSIPGLLPEDMRHPVIVELPLPVEGEYLLQMLLENHHHRENSVIVQPRPEISGLLNENLVEVAVEILDLVQ